MGLRRYPVPAARLALNLNNPDHSVSWRWTLALMAAVTIWMITASPAKEQPAPCVVRYTLGTPLNMRATPNGRVFATVHNGARVTVLDYDCDRRGRQWALILFTDRGAGNAAVSLGGLHGAIRCRMAI
jgi:hypothetical protein